MGDFHIIEDVSNGILKILRTYFVPNIIENPDVIALCSPEDKGDISLGIYLYDIKESEEIRNTSMINIDIVRQKYPSMYLTLYYMITAYSNGDIKYKSKEEFKMLGRVLQIFKDYPVFHKNTLEFMEKPDQNSIVIQYHSLSYEEKQKIWPLQDKAYKLSLFYKVTPVELESEKIKKINRVININFDIGESKNNIKSKDSTKSKNNLQDKKIEE